MCVWVWLWVAGESRSRRVVEGWAYGGRLVMVAGPLCVFFFFKQKTAYEMRISDWSSDVCSSDLIHRGGHVVVNPARADTAEERERSGMGVEHHLLRLAGIGSPDEHPAMAQPHMGVLHRSRHPRQHHDLVAPVELASLAGLEPQRHERGRRPAHFLAPPAPDR